MNITDYALLYAERAHRGQVRKYSGRPYIEHPIRVANKLIALNRGFAPDTGVHLFFNHAVAAAYLHDVVEDCGVSPETLLQDFGEAVSDVVVALSDPPKQPGENRALRKARSLQRLASSSPMVQSIKLADRIDNIRDSVLCPDTGFLRLYLKESTDLLNALLLADRRLRQELRETIDTITAAMDNPKVQEVQSCFLGEKK